MRQRTAFAIATVLTTFLLVIAAGVLARLAVVPPIDTGAQATPLATIAATGASLPAAREAEYQQTLQTAYAQLEKANQQLEEAYQRLTTQPTVITTPAVADAPTSISSPTIPAPLPTTEVVPTAPSPAVTEAVPTAVVPIVPPPVPSSAEAPAVITTDQAAATARAYAGGGTVERVRLEEEQGQRVYEVRFTNNSRVYIDPITGRVIYARLEGHDSSDDTRGNDD